MNFQQICFGSMRRPWGLGLRIQGSSLNPLVPPEGGGGVLNVELWIALRGCPGKI